MTTALYLALTVKVQHSNGGDNPSVSESRRFIINLPEFLEAGFCHLLILGLCPFAPPLLLTLMWILVWLMSQWVNNNNNKFSSLSRIRLHKLITCKDNSLKRIITSQKISFFLNLCLQSFERLYGRRHQTIDEEHEVKLARRGGS